MAGTDWIYVLPFLCSFLGAAGGRPKGKYFRRIGIGLVTSIFALIYLKEPSVLLCIPYYFVVTSIGYGKFMEKRWWIVIALIGATYGLASWPIAKITYPVLCLLQVCLSSAAFTGSAYFSNTGKYKLHWAMAEGLTWFFSTLLVPYMIL